LSSTEAMSSFVQAQPVIYGTSLGTKYPPSVPAATTANCYYVAGCHGDQNVVGDTFYGAAPTAVDPARCYLSGGDYDAGGYGQQTGYGGRYGQLPQQQQQQEHRMFTSEYQPHDVYRGYCTTADQPPRRSGSGPSLQYCGEELIGPAGDSPSAGLVPASSPGLCSRYSPSSVPPAAVPQLGSPPQPPVIYPWMKMVHSISGELIHSHTSISLCYSSLRFLL